MSLHTALRSVLTLNLSRIQLNIKRQISYAEISRRRSELFSAEKQAQKEKIGRIERIEVRYLGLPQDTTLMMNRGLSTPYNCAQHISEFHCKRSALALIDGNIPWDMHRPLPDSCTLQLLTFTSPDPHHVNRAFWRTCSFLLGAVLSSTFKDEAHLQLHSFPSPNYRSGSFIYDVSLAQADWCPTLQELKTLSAEMVKLAARNLPIERLEVSHELAREMFRENPFKSQQIPNIAQKNDGQVVIYRVGEHVDISRGPMVTSTRHLGRCSITSAHPVGRLDDSLPLYRFQGVALPPDFIINHIAYGILENRAKKLNPARLPTEEEQIQAKLA
ncbi:39S ribosomal protein L39, mitochondrial [Lutzomyia longipalpis]|uniref:39S ribosomal protein L39, mitochondrial n=1 Tax=Lutzomyia longipalpis TaxID=7200 RepID=UPI0024835A11|nr:39S ribosomal protein L39, mitochondrial [Lutzomyia longipalpis]